MVCYVLATNATGLAPFLLQPLSVLMRQKRQAVFAINQSIFLRCLCAQGLEAYKNPLKLT